MTETSLAGKVAVVTGGSRGIGFAVATMLVSRGVDVAVCGRSVDELARARERLEATTREGRTGRVETIRADVREPDQVDSLLATVVDRCGGIDIVVNNAGVGIFRELADLSIDEWRTVLDTNLSGVFFMARAAIPLLRQRGGGWIVNISSLAGSHPFKGGGAYCASKAGLDALTEVLMQEVRYDDIRVACVAPGSVATGFDSPARAPVSSGKLDSEDVAQAVVDLLSHPPRSLPSRVEIRPSRPHVTPR